MARPRPDRRPADERYSAPPPAESERALREGGPGDGARRAELERHAAVLFVGGALTMAIICGAVIVSGWFAGVIVDSWERLFWLGAFLGGLMVATFAAAAAPGGRNARRATLRITWLLRLGLLLFVLAPTLCILSLVGDYYRL
ncbi:hypothetical protein [Herbiconiux liukaitaii]|uniref:hypothetical protein n=1 Tax=Herbiconiux liukaitaii TaxID=3342799 RepID=UPI0035B866E2